MPTPVSLQPQESALRNLITGSPVSARHGARWASQIAYLLGRHGHRVCSHVVQPLVSRTSNSKRVQVHYLRSKSAQLALVAIELREDRVTSGGGAPSFPYGYAVNVTVTAPSGATWVDRGGPGELLDGTADITLANPALSGRRWLYGILDVSACSQTSVGTMTVDMVGAGVSTHLGFGTVSLVELPLATTRPESGESGLLLSWCDPRNWLEQGAVAAGPRGLSSLVDLEQQAAIRRRWWWQILGYEDSTPSTLLDSWYRTGAMSTLDWRGSLGTAYSPKWRTRVRQTHSGAMAVVVRARAYAASGGIVRVKMTPVGGSTSSYDVTFAASAAWAASSGSGSIVTTGTGQMVDIELEAEGTSGDTIYVSNVTLYQSEAL